MSTPQSIHLALTEHYHFVKADDYVVRKLQLWKYLVFTTTNHNQMVFSQQFIREDSSPTT
jgi:hypothetical protein